MDGGGQTSCRDSSSVALSISSSLADALQNGQGAHQEKLKVAWGWLSQEKDMQLNLLENRATFWFLHPSRRGSLATHLS